MKVSIIIPTFNAEKYLPTLLEKLKHQTITSELIIIDSSSTDKTLNIAKKYTNNIITIHQADFDHGGTRTKAAKISTGDILVFLTQDALPDMDDTIESLVSIFNNPRISATYGCQIPYDNTSLFGKHLRLFNYPNTSHTRNKNDINFYGIKTAFLSDSFAAYRRTSLEQIGWFKDNLILGEDSYAGAKLILNDGTIHYNAEVSVYHSHSYTVLQEFKRYFDIGVFHKKESWILESFGKAEGEGIKYIKSEFKYLLQNNAIHLMPSFLVRNLLKYMGYKLGQYHLLLPKYFIRNMSMHHQWW